jgi:small subunit ribosomal protein S19e
MAKKGITVKDIAASEYIKALATHFKNSGALEVPSWADHVKTGCFKQLGPLDPDWYYVRAGLINIIYLFILASIARKIYIRQGSGVGALKDSYGGSKNCGSCPCHHFKGSGKIIRLIIHQLEKAKLLEIVPGFI